MSDPALDFTPEQAACIASARTFNAVEAERFIPEMEANHYPPALTAALAEHGLLGLRFPVQYGGRGVGALAAALAIEELARISPAIADVLVCLHAGTGLLVAYGSEALKTRYLPQLSAGKILCSYGLTERGAGSDLASVATRAVVGANGFTVRGAKLFITLGAVSDIVVILAVTDPQAEKPHRGMSLLLVQGHNRGKAQEFMGLRGTAVGGISFQDLFVPRDHLVGELNQGFKHVMQSLEGGRIEVAALAVGLAQGALDESLKYARGRVQFGAPIAKQQAVQFLLAEMHTRIEAARRLTYHAARLRDAGRPHAREASEAKLFASEVALQCASDAVQIHGGYGYWKKYPVERLFRDAKITQIFEGTNQIQRMVIARGLLAE